MKEIISYSFRDSHAGFRNKISNLAEYIQIGKKAAEKAAKDEMNDDLTRQFLLGKLHAFDEIMSFFDEYKRIKYELQTNKGVLIYCTGHTFLYDLEDHLIERLPRPGMTPEEVIDFVNSSPCEESDCDNE